MVPLRSMKQLVLLLSVISVVSTAGESGQLRSNFRPANNVDVGTASAYAPSKSLFHAAEDFVDYEFHLLNRRLQEKTEVTRCNTWCKLKESLSLTIIGLLLICISPCLMWKNEGRHVKELRRIDFCKNKAVVIDNSDIPNDEHTGDLVHFVGKVSVDDDALDFGSGSLNISAPLANALAVKRTCLIYQKFEQATKQTKNDMIGAGQTTTTTFTIKEDWTSTGPKGPLEHFPNDMNSRGIWDELVSQTGSSYMNSSPAKMPPNLPPQMAELLQQVDLSQSPHGIAVSKSAHVGGFGLSCESIIICLVCCFEPLFLT